MFNKELNFVTHNLVYNKQFSGTFSVEAKNGRKTTKEK